MFTLCPCSHPVTKKIIVLLGTTALRRLKKNMFTNQQERSENPRYRRLPRAVLSFETKEITIHAAFFHIPVRMNPFMPFTVLLRLGLGTCIFIWFLSFLVRL